MSFNIGGFIAKSKGPNPYIVVAFKGTESTAEWLINANKLLTDAYGTTFLHLETVSLSH